MKTVAKQRAAATESPHEVASLLGYDPKGKHHERVFQKNSFSLRVTPLRLDAVQVRQAALDRAASKSLFAPRIAPAAKERYPFVYDTRNETEAVSAYISGAKVMRVPRPSRLLSLLSHL